MRAIIVLTIAFCINNHLVQCFPGLDNINRNNDCLTDAECGEINGAKCEMFACMCPGGQQLNQEKNACIDASPYIHSNCTADFQCNRLVAGYECDKVEKKCKCISGWRYLEGRCWPALNYGDECTTRHQCFHPYQPISMDCIDGVCKCADGYYTRQKRECRRISSKLGSACVLDTDCQIADVPDAVCNTTSLLCISPSAKNPMKVEEIASFKNNLLDNISENIIKAKVDDRCFENKDCQSLGSAECSKDFYCVCSKGYYPSETKTECYAELGTKIAEGDEKYCGGRWAVVNDGICECPAGFFYDSTTNRDCTKPSRFFNDSCVDDSFCYTFGEAGRCEDKEGTVFKQCECDEAISSKDESGRMCVLFEKAVNDTCDENDICPPGSECILNLCTCMNNTIALPPDNTRCVPDDLELGESCYIDDQCSVENSACIGTQCSCAESFYEAEGLCETAINGPCAFDEDCKIENSFCHSTNTSENEELSICVCKEGYIDENYERCLRIPSSFNDSCESSVQCWANFGDKETVKCEDKHCICSDGYYEASEKCWKKIGLGSLCTNSLECFLPSGNMERTECRNSMCQCKFSFETESFPDDCSGSGRIFGLQGLSIISTLILTMIYNIVL